MKTYIYIAICSLVIFSSGCFVGYRIAHVQEIRSDACVDV